MAKQAEEAIQNGDVEAVESPETKVLETENPEGAVEAEAIPETDVEEPEPKEKPRLERELTMDELVVKNREAREQELQEAREMRGLEEEEPEPVVEDPDKVIVELKVDGKIVKKTQAEVDRLGGVEAAQKSLSAQYRLDRAAEEQLRNAQQNDELQQRERELSARERKLEERLTALEQQRTEPVQKQSSEDRRKLSAEFISNVYSGREEDALENFEQALDMITKDPQEVNVDKIVENATAQAVFVTERNLGRREFSRQYSHLNSNNKLRALVNEETDRILKQNPDMSPYDIIMTAAKKVDDWAKTVTEDPEPETAQVDQEVEKRIERKKAQPTIQPASQRVQRSNEFKPKTPEQIMAEYRKTRHR